MTVQLISRDELKILTLMRTFEFLHGLPTPHLKKLAAIASIVEIPANTIIHEAGDLGQAIYLVQAGQVNIEIEIPDGPAVTVLVIRAGQIFGLSSMFPPQRKKGRARAMQPTQAITIDAQKLHHLFETDHDLERTIMGRTAKIINDRIKATWLQLAQTAPKR